MSRLLALLCALAAVCLAIPAAAQEPFYDDPALYKALFGQGETNVCFARRYDAAHLAAHPDQNVVAVAMIAHAAKPKDAGFGANTLFMVGKFALRPPSSYDFLLRCAPTSADGEPSARVPGCAAPNHDWADDGPILFALDAGSLVVKLPPGRDYSARPDIFASGDRAFRLERVALDKCPLASPLLGKP